MLRHDEDPDGGYRVLAEDLTDLGYVVSERRLWRLCRAAGVQSVISARKRRDRSAGAAVRDDPVQRAFNVDGPDQLWPTHITEHCTSGSCTFAR